MSNVAIQEFIYFFSTKSQVSIKCLQFLEQNQIPIVPVRLDSIEARRKAKNGKYFQVISVPTLVVIFADGNLQLLVGEQKIVGWTQQLLNSMREAQTRAQDVHQEPADDSQPARDGLYGPISPGDDDLQSSNEEDTDSSRPSRSSAKRKSSKKSRSRGKNRRKKKDKSRRSRKPKPPPPVDFGDEDSEEGSEIVFIEDEPDVNEVSSKRPSRQKPQSMAGAVVGEKALKNRPSRMNNLMELAKQMQKDRKDTLGYDEKDLPKSF